MMGDIHKAERELADGLARIFDDLPMLPDAPVREITYRSQHSVTVTLAADQDPIYCIEFAPGAPLTCTRIG